MAQEEPEDPQTDLPEVQGAPAQPHSELSPTNIPRESEAVTPAAL